MWELDCEEGWVTKNRCFVLWCWRRLLRVPWTARRSNQSVLKEINPGISLDGMLLKWSSCSLATSCEEFIYWKRLWCWERLGAGGEEDDRGWDGWMAWPAWWREFEWIPGVGDGQGGLACCNSWGRKEWDTTEWLNWTENRVWYKKCPEIKEYWASGKCFFTIWN